MKSLVVYFSTIDIYGFLAILMADSYMLLLILKSENAWVVSEGNLFFKQIKLKKTFRNGVNTF